MAAQKKQRLPQKQVVTPVGTVLRAFVHTPDTQAPEGATFKPDGKFKVAISYPSSEALDKALESAYAVAEEMWPGKPRDEILTPFIREYERERDGEKETVFLIQAKSKYKPESVDAYKNHIPSSIEIRGGDRARAVIVLFPYEKPETVIDGKKRVQITTYGISARLSLVQLIEKRKAGAAAALEALDDLDDGFSVSEFDDAPSVTDAPQTKYSDAPAMDAQDF
jgi:hypothetical protein